MKKYLLLSSLIFLVHAASAQTDPLMKNDIIRIDSIVASIDEITNYREIKITGVSSRDAYHAVAYTDAVTNVLRKLAIDFNGDTEDELIYIAGNKIIKGVNKQTDYYRIENTYYSAGQKKIESPATLSAIRDNEVILVIILKLLAPVN